MFLGLLQEACKLGSGVVKDLATKVQVQGCPSHVHERVVRIRQNQNNTRRFMVT